MTLTSNDVHLRIEVPRCKTQGWKIDARTEMQISGAAAGEWHLSMFDGIHSFSTALWQILDSMER